MAAESEANMRVSDGERETNAGDPAKGGMRTRRTAFLNAMWLARARRRLTRRLLRHHLPLLLASGALVAAIDALVDRAAFPLARDSLWRLSVATAYVSLLWLCLTLLLGPLNVLRRRPNPVSTYLRRDIGLWAAGVGVAHVTLATRLPLANWSNQLGTYAEVLLLALAALSNDVALRLLKPRRWKWLQRLNYAVFALVGAHALIWQAHDRRIAPYAMLTGLAVAGVLVVQVAGWRARMRRGSGYAFLWRTRAPRRRRT